MQASPNSVMGAYEAKTHFAELLERVASGEKITITRHGSPIVQMIPVQPTSSLENRREAIQKMRELASQLRLDGLRVKDLVAEGRK